MAYIPPEAQAEIVKLENRIEEVQKRERALEEDLARQSRSLDQARWWGYVATGLALILLALVVIHRFVRPIGLLSRGGEQMEQADMTPLVEDLQLAMDEANQRADSLENALANCAAKPSKPASTSSRRSTPSSTPKPRKLTVEGVVFKVLAGSYADFGLEPGFSGSIPLSGDLQSKVMRQSLGTFEDFNNARALKLSNDKTGNPCFIVAEKDGALVPIEQVVNEKF